MAKLIACLAILAWTLADKGSAPAQDLPTLYEYYTGQGISAGLTAPNTGFTLNGLPITIYSGAIHYFRVPPQYWRDRLRKARAAGLNAVETYVPWNLHEPYQGEYDFGDGQEDLSALLDIRQYLRIAQEEDLFVLFRPGPYICSEWEFGGLPSWLLRYKNIKVRTSDPDFTSAVKNYFDKLLPLVEDLTFQQGGPIIAIQLENEYGSFGPTDSPRDTAYLEFLRDLYRNHSIEELLYTSDAPAGSGDIGALPGELQTANFAWGAKEQFEALMRLQPDKALMVMEYWTGWFDHWTQPFHDTGHTPDSFAEVLTEIFSYNASVNMYMFHGGTSFGFMNGGNVQNIFPFFLPDVSSYDYGAPLSEAGDYTEKYWRAKELISSDNQISTAVPDPPQETQKIAYPTMEVTEYMNYQDLINALDESAHIRIPKLDVNSSMENLMFNQGRGQSYGYVAYQRVLKALSSNATLKIVGHVHDIAMVLVNGVQQTVAPDNEQSLAGFGFWPASDAEMTLQNLTAGQEFTLDIVVENFGRNNFGWPEDFNQKKGLWEGDVTLDGETVNDWDVYSLEMKGKWLSQLVDNWQTISPDKGDIYGPALFRATFTIDDEPKDTFIDMSSWVKGCVFVNGFPLGRHFNLGPQMTNYIPAPLLLVGSNTVLIFEQYSAGKQVNFTNKPSLGRAKP